MRGHAAPRAGRGPAVKRFEPLTGAERGAYDSPRTMPQTFPRPRKARVAPPVVDLARARDAKRVRELVARCRAVDEVNRKSIAQLFRTGLVFTRAGARLGRDLLLAHQHLLRASVLLSRIAELPPGAPHGETAALYDEAQALLARTAELTSRSGPVLARGN